ncbi:hypothetical protein ABTE40_22060, partial [Acinetobacter baumannii]
TRADAREARADDQHIEVFCLDIGLVEHFGLPDRDLRAGELEMQAAMTGYLYVDIDNRIFILYQDRRMQRGR